jgi:2-iminobutanoate/2-iminopropanoate deaminase
LPRRDDGIEGLAFVSPARYPGDMAESLIPVDPDDLARSPAFAQGMIAPSGPTLYVGGQNGTDATGALLDGLRAQTEQALRNVLAVLAEAGTGPEYVAKLNIHLAPDIDPTEAYAASAEVWGAHRTAVTVLAVAPAKPGALVEIDAVAVIPQR